MKDIFNLSEVAKLLKISPKTLHKWIQFHDLKTGCDADGRCRTLTLLQVKKLAKVLHRSSLLEEIEQELDALYQGSDLIYLERKIIDLKYELDEETAQREKLQKEVERLKKIIDKL